MRISIAILIFLILFNGWASLLMDYDLDDHLGVNVEVGDHPELEQAQSSADDIEFGTGGVLESMVGGINTMLSNLGDLVKGLNPAAQMLVNIIPPGIGEALVLWAFSILEIIVAADLINYVRGTG